MPLRPHGCARNGIARRRIGGKNMANLTFDKEITALLVIDPYNDFISEGGKVWDRLKTVAEANSCVPHMLQVLTAARKAGLRVFYALHRRYRPGDYETWKCRAPSRVQTTPQVDLKKISARALCAPTPGQARQHRSESGRGFIDEDKQALGSRGTRHGNRGTDCWLCRRNEWAADDIYRGTGSVPSRVPHWPDCQSNRVGFS